MRQTKLGSWLVQGSPGLRFAKEFSFNLAVSMIVWCALFYGNRHIGPKLFTDMPFVSEDFWVTCVCYAFGFAIVGAASNGKIQKNRTLAE